MRYGRARPGHLDKGCSAHLKRDARDKRGHDDIRTEALTHH
jgi:hypothetical protein